MASIVLAFLDTHIEGKVKRCLRLYYELCYGAMVVIYAYDSRMMASLWLSSRARCCRGIVSEDRGRSALPAFHDIDHFIVKKYTDSAAEAAAKIRCY